ncbi:MAG: 5'/3'-nucleotidase SurE, partial [Chloroflexota bacterium]|nr:5'/3'-nucleotidase SurE [Chloroflexota bacterium]
NDDGIDSLSIPVLRETLARVGEVTVFVPSHNWSAAGHTKTMHKPLRVNRVELADGVTAYTSNGAPSDCVALAMMGILPRKPDLVVSGINQGGNLGQDITYSGTVAAAIEGVIFGLPAMAVSLDSFESQDFSYAAEFTARLVNLVLVRGLPPGILLNVNVPAVPREQIKGVLITRLGKRVYSDTLVKRQDPRGRNYYWIGGEPPSGVPEEGTDIWALANDYISITPLHLDMTDYRLLKKMRRWGIGGRGF